MMKILLALWVLTISLAADTSNYVQPATNDCGTSRTDFTKCSNVGPWDAAPASPTTISSVPFSAFASSTNYVITANLGATLDADALVLNGTLSNINIYIADNVTLTGRIRWTTGLKTNVRIYGGGANAKVSCSDASTLTGCIAGANGGSWTGFLRIDHLIVDNQATGSDSRGIHFDFGSSTCGGAAAFVRVDHVLGTSTTFLTGTRWPIVNVQSFPCAAQLDHNHVHCIGSTSACQGLQCLYSPSCLINNNRVEMDTVSGVSQDGRGINCDTSGGQAHSADYCWAIGNYINAHNNRCARFRMVYHARFFSNIIDNVAANGGVGCLDVGDSSGVMQDNADFLAANNSVYVQDGVFLWGRDISGVTVVNTGVSCLASCAGGTFASVAAPIGTGTTNMNVCNNPGVSGIGFTTENTVATAATVNYANTGAMSGTGTKNVVTGCPQ